MVLGDITDTIISALPGAAIAAIPGILVALVSHFLTIRRDRLKDNVLAQNGQALLALELNRNRAALATFWHDINALDTEHAADDSEDHLAGMLQNGLLARVPPHFNYARWERVPAQALGSLDPTLLAKVDAMYRDMHAFSELYAHILKMEPDERAQLEHDRFWYNRYAYFRIGAFEQLFATTNRILTHGDPFGQPGAAK